MQLIPKETNWELERTYPANDQKENENSSNQTSDNNGRPFNTGRWTEQEH